MNVGDLIKKLSKMPKKSEVCVSGYEGGLKIVDGISIVDVEKDVHTETWYMGDHEDRTDEVKNGNFPVEKTCKMVQIS